MTGDRRQGDDVSNGPDISEVGSVHVLIDPDRVHIVLSGEIDSSTAPDLTTAASEALATAARVEVDCRYVTFMDSTGIGFLARLAARSTQRVRLLHPPAKVRFLLEMVKIADLLEIVDGPAPEPPPVTEGPPAAS
jgi:anti-anti-sigma factor